MYILQILKPGRHFLVKSRKDLVLDYHFPKCKAHKYYKTRPKTYPSKKLVIP